MDAKVRPMEHHKKQQLCTTRASYRQGKEFKALKVYTINDESQHMLLLNIPKINIGKELRNLCCRFGSVQNFESLPSYSCEEPFSEAFYVKYGSLKEARYAKKKLDNREFYGGIIHICYAPELETVDEYQNKLFSRIKYVNNSHQNTNLMKKVTHVTKTASIDEDLAPKASTSSATYSEEKKLPLEDASCAVLCKKICKRGEDELATDEKLPISQCKKNDEETKRPESKTEEKIAFSRDTKIRFHIGKK